MKTRPTYNRFTYWVSAKHPIVYESKGYWIEHHPKLDMYRINTANVRLRNRKWFMNHMGYSPHYAVLLEALDRLPVNSK
jgi:hypothetical protein